ncbi:hypothetical protein [Granulicella arctica]|uniref:hypothetical protein n=1 Tax=Granulicella arctica TaxID=940613 RepID=UPI0021DF5458|nr:hypothetical protein [Granulicella arctica]
MLEQGRPIPDVPATPTGLLQYLPWVIPIASTTLSLLAILYVFETKKNVDKDFLNSKWLVDSLTQSLKEVEDDLISRTPIEETKDFRNGEGRGAGKGRSSSFNVPQVISHSKPAVSRAVARPEDDSAAFRPKGYSNEVVRNSIANPVVLRAAAPSESPEQTSGVLGDDRSQPDERPTSVLHVEAVGPQVSVREPLPDPRKSTGEIVADYNKARTMGDDAGEWFKSNYEWVGLSCKNSNERLLDPNVVLLFQEESRGSFLGISCKGEMRLVPALDKELEVSSSFLMDVFDYPPQITGRLELRRAATIEKNGGLWELKQSGEIALER